MLGGNRDRVAEAERVGVQPARFAGGAFHLVGDQHGRLARLADEFGEHLVDPGRTAARVDHEKDRIGLPNRGLGLRAHAAGKALGRRLLKSRGIDHGEIKIAEPALAFAAVARHTRPVVDQRDAPANQPVEQSRLADIGAADDGDGEVHGQRSGPHMAGDALLTCQVRQRETVPGGGAEGQGAVPLCPDAGCCEVVPGQGSSCCRPLP